MILEVRLVLSMQDSLRTSNTFSQLGPSQDNQPVNNSETSGFHPEGIILGGEAPGNGCGFIYFSIQLSQILGGKLPPRPPSG